MSSDIICPSHFPCGKPLSVPIRVQDMNRYLKFAQDAVDKYFDMFELYTLRNVFSIPEDVSVPGDVRSFFFLCFSVFFLGAILFSAQRLVPTVSRPCRE